MASQSNVGLQQAQLAMKMNEQKVKLERSELLPKIALVAGEHLDGPITIEVPVLDNNFNYWYVGSVSNTIFLLYLKTTRKCARQN